MRKRLAQLLVLSAIYLIQLVAVEIVLPDRTASYPGGYSLESTRWRNPVCYFPFIGFGALFFSGGDQTIRFMHDTNTLAVFSVESMDAGWVDKVSIEIDGTIAQLHHQKTGFTTASGSLHVPLETFVMHARASGLYKENKHP